MGEQSVACKTVVKFESPMADGVALEHGALEFGVLGYEALEFRARGCEAPEGISEAVVDGRAAALASERAAASVFISTLVFVLAICALILSSWVTKITARTQASHDANSAAFAMAHGISTQSLGLTSQINISSMAASKETDGFEGTIIQAESQRFESSASTRVVLSPPQLDTAPALIAVIARASQLLQVELVPIKTLGYRVLFSQDQALLLDSVAFDLGLCRVEQLNGAVWFEHDC